MTKIYKILDKAKKLTELSLERGRKRKEEREGNRKEKRRRKIEKERGKRKDKEEGKGRGGKRSFLKENSPSPPAGRDGECLIGR
ncbi:MAG: hypothetical protein IKH88_14660 [Prevotella sp.]|nr:hypothetical protein [Prevotella sp.]